MTRSRLAAVVVASLGMAVATFVGATAASTLFSAPALQNMESPRIASTDVDVLWLLATFGEACPFLILGVYCMEDYVEKLAF